MRRDWLVPLTGVAFIASLIAGFAVTGSPPQAKDGGKDVIQFYVDNADSVAVGSALVTLGGLFFIFFANYLREVFRFASGPTTTIANTVLVGASIFAVGAAIDSSISLSLSQAGDDITPSAAQALQAFFDNDFLPLALGVEVFLVSVAISVLRTGALPRWLGWVAAVLVVLGVTPAGFIAFIGAGVWVLVVSVMLALRARNATQPPASSPPAAA
jgi:hypothetical protein